MQDGAPLCLEAHSAHIEAIQTDGHLLVSQCLAGKMVVWDTLTGEIISRISRSVQHEERAKTGNKCQNFLPKKQQFEGVAIRNHLRSRKSRSVLYNKFSDNFTNDCDARQPDILSGASIWCFDVAEGLVVLGCDSGLVEVYDVVSGVLQCQYDDRRCNGVTHLKLLPGKVVVARVDGHLEYQEIVSWSQQASPVTRSRIWSNDSLASYGEELGLSLTCSVRAHLQSISCLEVRGPRLITGSADHTLRVFRAEDAVSVYTLHGHTGPITCIFIDSLSPSTAGSASKDGMMCVWDLLTGACMYSIQVKQIVIALCSPVILLLHSFPGPHWSSYRHGSLPQLRGHTRGGRKALCVGEAPRSPSQQCRHQRGLTQSVGDAHPQSRSHGLWHESHGVGCQALPPYQDGETRPRV